MKRSGQLKRSQGLSKRTTKRRTTSPRCIRQRCGKPAKIRDLCVTHAMREADRLFSVYVRENDGVCTFPKHLSATPCEGPLQAAHGEPRGNYATRYDRRNVHGVCRTHHMMLDSGSKHALKAAWLSGILGGAGYDELMEDALRPADKHAAIDAALGWLT